MKVADQLEALEAVASQLGIKIRYEPLGALINGTGGICRVNGEYRVIIDRRLKPGERVGVLADAMTRFDTRNLEMPNAIRSLVEPREQRSA